MKKSGVLDSLKS